MSSPVYQEPVSAAGLWQQFKGANVERVALLGRAAEALENDALDAELRQQAQRAAHQLAGALGSFGFPRGTTLAREAEKVLRGTEALDPGVAPRLHDLFGSLIRELQGEPSEWQSGLPASARTPDAPLLLVVEDDLELAGALIAEAHARGLRAQRVIDPAAALVSIAAEQPDVLLLDLSFPTAAEDGLMLLARLSKGMFHIPVLVLTGRDCFVDRVEVARFGGRGFLQKPMPAWEVLDGVTDLLHQQRPQRAKVLAVDDDPQILKMLSAVLEPRGLAVTTETDPVRFWEALDETSPDLLILDVDMPQISGIELCQVVRNDPRWASLPILFLTARIDADSIHQMFAAGADDYVCKPIVGPELVTRITNRVERTRLLREMADTDYLTGLSNRRRSGQEVERMVRLAERQGQPFSLAILDLDRFKAINDQHGHAAGDEVLRRIGELLLSTFRSTDVAGRWGGEEFVLGMLGMGRGDAVERVAMLLETLRGEHIHGPESSFSVSFSAGVAGYPEDGADLGSLYRSADKALYEAKAAGRNRVLPAGWSPDGSQVDFAICGNDPMLSIELPPKLATRGYTARSFEDVTTLIAECGADDPALHPRVLVLDAAWAGFVTADDVGRVPLLDIPLMLLGEADITTPLRELAFDQVPEPYDARLLLKRLRLALSHSEQHIARRMAVPHPCARIEGCELPT